MTTTQPGPALVTCLVLTIVCATAIALDERKAGPAKTVGPERLAAIQQELEFLQSAQADASAVKELVSIDGELRDTTAPAERALQTKVLVALAHHANAAALEHLRSVFETQTSRRHDAAYAISLAALNSPSNDQDWRYLVRSLPIVEGEQAGSVLTALSRFRRRATKPVWVREVILVGLKLPAAQQTTATRLLEHWTQHSMANGSPQEQLQAWQEWFREEFPDEPDPTLPADPPGAKHTWQTLTLLIGELPSEADAIAAGEALFTKATCQKCHRRGNTVGQPEDNRLGPDLTSLGWRRQPQEILTAILYPSHRLNDEYPVTTVVLANGKSASGLMMPAADKNLKVVASDGKETVFAASELEESRPSRVSNMPSGLLEPLTHEQVGQLLAFLSAQDGTYDPHSERNGNR